MAAQLSKRAFPPMKRWRIILPADERLTEVSALKSPRRLLCLIVEVIVLLSALGVGAQAQGRSAYVRQRSKDSVIVFVHGVFGDSRETWTNATSKAYWPQLMTADPFFDSFDIYTYSYPSPARGNTYTNDELVEDMRRDLEDASVFQTHKRVIFLCHSMGGIVVRAFLTRYQPLASKVPMIYFFSTPTTGAEIAALAKLLSNNPQLNGVLPMDSESYLATIQKDWLAAQFRIASYCAYETQDTHGIRVVTLESATNLCNRRLDPINADHISIVKPRDQSDTSYIAFRNAVREVQLDEKPPNRSPASGNSQGTLPALLPVEGLSELGWTVQPGTPEIQFEINGKPLPDMEASARYFRLLHKPFRLHFQSVPGIAGLHLLAEIDDCKKIEINAGDFSDISELRGFTKLTSLVISQTPLNGLSTVDSSPLSSLTGLRELVLGSTRITDLSPIAKLSKLTALNVQDTLVRDLAPIAGLRSLETVEIRGIEAADISPLAQLASLKELGIDGKQIPGLVKLTQLEHLKYLRIIDQSKIDLSAVGQLSGLETLFIWGPPNFDLSPLRTLTNLQALQVSGLGMGFSVVTGADALGDLKALKRLTLGYMNISDLTFVSNLRQLNEINIGVMPVSSVEPLRELLALETVSLDRTNIVDISPLLALPQLRKLSVVGSPARSDVLTELERRGVSVQR